MEHFGIKTPAAAGRLSASGLWRIKNQKLSESRGPQDGPRSSSFDLALQNKRPQNGRRREQMAFKPQKDFLNLFLGQYTSQF
jgi:hypothetical protein